MLEHSCTTYRALFPDGDLAGAWAQHAQACPECAHWSARRRMQSEALGGLMRESAPQALAELVTTALTSPFREARAVRALECLRTDSNAAGNAHGDAQDELDFPLESEPTDAAPRGAPQVLDRLVAEELADLPRAVSRRMLQRLPKVAAPGSLAGRLASEQRMQSGIGTNQVGSRSERQRPSSLLGLRSWAAALLILGLGLLSARLWTTRAQRSLDHIEIVRTSDPAQLGPFARGLAEGLAGNLGRRAQSGTGM